MIDYTLHSTANTKVQTPHHWAELTSELFIPIYKPTLYDELLVLISEANKLVELYASAKTLKEKQLIFEHYNALCKEILAIKSKIAARQTNQLVNRILKVAAYFKKLAKKFIRNIQTFFRRIIRFLFKNMDDNSGEAVFQFFGIEKRLIHHKFSSNVTIRQLNKSYR